jgi:hypothetical protein
MPKIIFLDTYYPNVFKNVPDYKIPAIGQYDSRSLRQNELNKLHFGTSYYYSRAFSQMGWDAEDIVGNDPTMYSWVGAASNEILSRDPDIVYCQDLGFLSDQEIYIMKSRGIKLVAQHSCPWAGDDRVRQYDIVFTSFPHYLERIRQVGTRAEFLPIAFGHWVLDYVEPQPRDIDICFIGGVNGTSGHWSKGTELLEEVAKQLPERFRWWGYSIGNLRSYPNLSKTYGGEAWGLEMYRILARSKMVINRHGEVAQGYSNNMRLFETTGMGAMLLTEKSKNLSEYFIDGKECVSYESTSDLIDTLNAALYEGLVDMEDIAKAGQARTLKDHTYEKRLAAIEPILKELIK